MNQYERIVSYIHQYQEGRKGENVGYAKIERRGESCRIQVQMRNSYISKSPQIYLFKQLDRTIRTVQAGEATIKGNEIYYKGNTEVGDLFGSKLPLEDIDGLLIYVNRHFYFATSWKNDGIDLGDWQADVEETGKTVSGSPADDDRIQQGIEEKRGEMGEQYQEKREETVDEKADMQRVDAAAGADNVTVSPSSESSMTAEMAEAVSGLAGQQQKISEAAGEDKKESGEVEATEAARLQMQAICGVCPFKRQNVDYGKRILLSYPTMRPFPEEKTMECVRLELQDIGCLPMKYWSLSGNRFLLHGYYCYRHLIFCQRDQGEYMLGVPGIYNEREQKNANRFGFGSFRSIGGYDMQKGAFGYWMMELM